MFVTHGVLSYLVISVIVIIPFWKIFEKAGYPPALSILTVIPVLNLVTLYVMAFSDRLSRDAA